MVKVTVVGAGKLGLKIAGNLAYHGHEVQVYDSNPEVLDKVHSRIQEDKKLLMEDGFLSTPDFVGKLHYIGHLEEALQSSDFIFESVPEDLVLKQDLFQRISMCCKHDAIIATNSLHFHCDEVAKRALLKKRCLGLRFLFPVYYIQEVEVSPGTHTSISALEKVSEFLKNMGMVTFLRSTSKPCILTDEERKNKKAAFLKHLKEISRGFENSVIVKEETHGGSVEYQTSASKVQKERDCVVCMDEERSCVLSPCHHFCMCYVCGEMLQKQNSSCPICREHIISVLQVFRP